MARVSFYYPAWGGPKDYPPSKVCTILEQVGRAIAEVNGVPFGEIEVSHGDVVVTTPEDSLMIDYSIDYVTEGFVPGVAPNKELLTVLALAGDADPTIDVLCAYEV